MTFASRNNTSATVSMLRSLFLALLLPAAAVGQRQRITIPDLNLPDPNDYNSHQLCSEWFVDCAINPDCIGSATDNAGCPEDMMRKPPAELLMRCYPGVSGYCSPEYCCQASPTLPLTQKHNPGPKTGVSHSASHAKTQPRAQDAKAQTVEKGETITTVRSQHWVLCLSYSPPAASLTRERQ